MCEPSHEDVLTEQDKDHSLAPSIAEFRIQLSENQSKSKHLQDLRKYAKQDD